MFLKVDWKRPECDNPECITNKRTETRNKPCTECGAIDMRNTDIVGMVSVHFDSDEDDYEVIECSECNKEKSVEKGTWALDKGMCEQCYCEYQGG